MSKELDAHELAAMREEAMEVAGLGMYKCSLDGTLLFIDAGTIRILELEDQHPDPRELVGRNVVDLVVYLTPPGQLRDDIERRGQIHGEEYSFRTLRGTEKWVVHHSYYLDGDGGDEAIQVVIQDITDRKRIEKALLITEERYRGLFDQMVDGFALWEAVPGDDGEPVDLRYVEVNATYEKLAGALAPAMVGKTVTELGHTAVSRVLSSMLTVERTGVSARIEQYSKRQDKHFEGVVFSPRRGHVAAIFTDVTERRRLEAQLRQAAKMEAIGTLAGGVAHEINNPVNIIMNYGELIAREVGHESRAAEFAREIITESQRIAEIVKGLLAFARSERETYSQVDVRRIVDAAVVLVGKVLSKDQISMEVDVADDLPEVLCRTQQIQQVVMNLVTNARDALNQRYSGYDDNKVIRISACAIVVDGDPWVRTTIEDRGVGIAPETMERVFDPFFTTKPTGAGTGLGLSVSHGIVDDHGGRLWVESEVGRWTRFHVDLAALPGELVARAGHAESPEVRGE